MSQFLVIVMSGLVTGAIYSIFASGLTLTYAASGIYNLAFGSFAFVAALFYFELGGFMPRPIAFVLTVFVFAPALGLALERVVFRRLARAPTTARLVGSVGLLLALPAAAILIVDRLVEHWPGSFRPLSAATSAPGIGPVPPDVYRIGSGSLNSDQFIVLGVTAIVVFGLWLLLNKTRIGLMTRAVVDRAELANLRGIDPAFTSRVAWTLSSILAALAGILAGPLFGLNFTTFLQFVIASSAVVVLARFRSLLIAVVGGLLLGAATSLATSYGAKWRPTQRLYEELPGARQGVIYLVLLGALLWRGRQQVRAAGVTVAERVQPDYLADLPTWRRLWPWVALSAALIVWATGILPWGRFEAGPLELQLLIQGIGMSMIFLSFVVVVGLLGVPSLAQGAFATLGALGAGYAVGHGWLGGNFLVAIFAAGVLAAVFGLLMALPALRLGGLALALATLAFGFIGDTILFLWEPLNNYGLGWGLERPQLGPIDFNDDRNYVVLLFVFLGVGVWLVTNLRRSRTGRAIYAVRFADAAAAAVGISKQRAVLLTFAFTGFLAGVGGALLAYGNRTANAGVWPTLTGILWLVIAMIQGVRRPAAAVLGGLIFAIFPRVLGTGFWGLIPEVKSVEVPTILFGLGALILANQPDGVLADTSRQNYVRRQKWRARRSGTPDGTVDAAEPETPVTSTGHAAVPQGVSAEQVAVEHTGTDAIVLSDLSAGYGESSVLRDVNLRVPEGSIVAVLGPNGSGKSTLCGAIAGVVDVTGGVIELFGDEITSTEPYERTGRGMLMAPESRGIFPTLTVQENLSIWLHDNDDVQRAYERFPRLRERASLAAGSLSGGEQQMLCLAPLLVKPPKMLLADEVTLGLAPAIVTDILGHIRELRDAGTTILMVEEKARNVLGLADYCAFLSLGTVTAFGPMSDFTEDIIAERYLGTHAVEIQGAGGTSGDLTGLSTGPSGAVSELVDAEEEW